MRQIRPGRDRRAEYTSAPRGAARASGQTATVIGAGIAGLAAAVGLAERGVEVTLVEPHAQSGGRVRAWRVSSDAGDLTMSRGFHAFFRQYYNLRKLLSRAGNLEDLLRPVDDYPVVHANGDADSFRRIPRRPPLNAIGYVAQSPTFRAKDLTRVNLDRALSLLDVDFPRTFHDLDGVSAQAFLDDLRFPDRARHLALQVFARSFFAHPDEFSAGELVAMFHTYFLGSAEGLLFDVPRDDFDTTLWAPLERYLAGLGVTRIVAEATSVEPSGDAVMTRLRDGATVTSDAVVIAAGPNASRRIIEASTRLGDANWRGEIASQRAAPPFAVWRLWLDRRVRRERPAFLGTAGFGPLDNISVLERFEQGAANWSRGNGGSVVELHAYAIPEEFGDASGAEERLRVELWEGLARAYPEVTGAGVRHDEFLIHGDCPLIDTRPFTSRPGVSTPHAMVKLAGDHVRCDTPVALMERAATTGWMAANDLLSAWTVAGHDLWSVPTTHRQVWPGTIRRLTAWLDRFRTER